MRLRSTFDSLRARGEKALVAYLTAGDPSFDTSLAACRAALRGGADVLELGVPFSDPMADGPAIQKASERALKAGMSVQRTLDLARALRSEFAQPIVLFGYYNPLLAYGLERVCAAAAEAGADGFLVVDLPPEEAGELRLAARAQGLDLIHLLAPTSTAERIELVRAHASGFVYYVSMTGVTGTRVADFSEIRRGIERVRGAVSAPVCVGFGITTPDDAAALAPHADGVVVGSALVRLCEEHAAQPEKLAAEIEGAVRALKAATRP